MILEKGRFITFEGGEGTGKSTQVVKLADELKRAGYDVLTTREPGGSKGAEEIRELLVKGEVGRWDAATEALLHFAARRDHLVKTVWPALRRGIWVISDRYADSTMAYQGYGHEWGRDNINALYKCAIGDFKPDLTIMLDIPVEEGLARANKRIGIDNYQLSLPIFEDRYERMGKEFHNRMRQAFLDMAVREPERCVVISASMPIKEVSAAVKEIVADRLDVTFKNQNKKNK